LSMKERTMHEKTNEIPGTLTDILIVCV